MVYSFNDWDRFKRIFRAYEAHFLTHPMDLLEMHKNWLYGPWNENKLKMFEFQQSGIIPLIDKYNNYLLDLRADHEYMDRYGMTYEDIHDPRKLRQTSSGSALIGSSINFVSDNVRRLYR